MLAGNHTSGHLFVLTNSLHTQIFIVVLFAVAKNWKQPDVLQELNCGISIPWYVPQ